MSSVYLCHDEISQVGVDGRRFSGYEPPKRNSWFATFAADGHVGPHNALAA